MKRPRTSKIIMTVFCLKEDAEDVERQLLDDFFAGNSTSLANIKVEVLDPTPDEEREACDSLDLILEDEVEVDPSEWTIEECVNFIETTFGKSILTIAMHEISNDDVEGWRNEVRRRIEEK
jgi:hypothetical protein